jgi:Tfp pilus assembly protein PilF
MLDKVCFNCGRDLPPATTLPITQKGLSGSLITESPTLPTPAPQVEPQVSPVADLLARLPIPTRTTNELFVDLGVRLYHDGIYEKAVDAFEEARDADGHAPTATLLFYLALASEKAEQFKKSFRAYLEGTLLEPEQLDSILTYLHTRLTTDIALKHGSWIIKEWLQQVDKLPLSKTSQARVALFTGHVKLFLADYTGALADFEQAVQHAPDVALSLAGEILTDERLPGALSSSQENGDTHYLRAQLFITLHSYEVAAHEVDKALAAASNDSTLAQNTQALKDQLLQLASFYYDQGTTAYGNSDFTGAIEQLRLSAQLRPSFAPVYWYWADALFIQSNQAQEINDRRPLIEEGIRIWQVGYGYGAPDATFAWAYTTRALLCEAMASLPENNTVAYWWEAAAHIESSLLLGKDDAYNWAYLGRYHRFLNNEQNALGATARAMDLADTNTRIDILTDRFAILTNAGRVEDAEPLSKELVEKFPNPWMKTARAIVLMNLERLDECIALLNEAVQEDDSLVWPRYLRAYACRRQGQIERSNQDYDWLLSYTQEQLPSDRDYFAWAQYQCGNVRKAIAYFESLLDNPVQASYFNLGLCYLKLGEAQKARPHLLKGIHNATNNRQLNDYTRDLDDLANSLDLPELRQLAAARALIPQVRAAIEQQKAVIAGQHRTSESELRQVFRDYTHHSDIGRWAWIGARAGLARIYRDQLRWLEAAEMYRLLLREGDRFPQARLGLEKTADALFAWADEILEEKRFQEALVGYQQAVTFVPTLLAGDGQRLGDLQARLGMAHFLMDERDAARSHFATSLKSYRDGKVTSPGKALGAMCSALLSYHPGSYWTLQAEWQSWLQEATLDASLREELRAALIALDAYLDDLFKLTGSRLGEDIYKPSMPIAIVLGSGLIPEDTSTTSWPLFTTYLPAMRARFKEELGFDALYVQIYDDYSIQPNEYRFLLDDIPAGQRSVSLNRRFSPASREKLVAAGIPTDSLEEAENPHTSQMGCWVAPDYYQRVIEHGYDLWAEPLEYVVRDLDRLLHMNIARFLGTQEVEDLLAAWRKEEPLATWIDQALADADMKFYFARALRALIREEVPIHQWQDVLARMTDPAFAQADTNAALRSLRLVLRESLPGNNPPLPHVSLGAEREKQLAEGIRIAQGSNDLTLFFTAVASIIELIQQHLPAYGRCFALVSQDPQLRLFIRYIIDLIMNTPLLPVLTQEEALYVEEGASRP